AGIGVIIAAQIEGISGAAAMIRYAREQNVKEAALDFIHVCEKAANIEVKAMLADMKLLDDPDLADQHADIERRLVKHHEYWTRHVGELRELYETKRVNALGGQPELRGSMGPFAATSLFAPTPASWDGLGQQIQVVFSGATAMSRYVVKQYGQKD
ncbi:MAG: hypothetical protein M3Q68_09735, partial [Actinomycetota bacterium]|nr:hypothetical protein [Actinomycetota bacterium]